MITIEQVNDPQNGYTQTSATIIHAVKGRIRIRILWLKDYPSLVQRIETAIRTLPWVTQVIVNSKSNSTTVYYQSENIALVKFQQHLLDLIDQLTPMTAENPSTVSAAPFEDTLQRVGGRIIGSSVGSIMGISLGSLTGGVLLGPIGIITGLGVGSFLGQMVGGQVGSDLVRDWQLEDINPDTPKEEEPLDIGSQLQESLTRGGSEMIADAVGGVVGGIIGGVTLGIPGLILGRIVGGAIAGELSDDLWYEESQKNKTISS